MPKRDNLPRNLSLKSRREISLLYKEGRRLEGNHLTLAWQPADRFGYAILLSRRNGPAVQRNRIKRLFREAIRLCRKNLKQNLKILVLPRIRDRKAGFEEIRTDFGRVVERLNEHQ